MNPTEAIRIHHQSIVIDNVESPQYVGVSRAVFSPDSKRVAFTGVAGKYGFVVVDGVPGKFYDWTGEPRFTRPGLT